MLGGGSCDKWGQIGAIGEAGYYGFTTIVRFKIEKCKMFIWRRKTYPPDFLLFRYARNIIPIHCYCSENRVYYYLKRGAE